MKIIAAHVSNFKRIVLASLENLGDKVEVTGRNKAGKSSLLDAVEYALGGRRRAPDKPVRDGADEARVVLDLGDIEVIRTTSAEGKDRLVVQASDGAEYPRAQEKLNSLVGSLAFDPYEFDSMKPSEQAATLLKIAGVDLDDFSARYDAAYARRRVKKRDLQGTLSRLGACPGVDPETPEKEISISDLTVRLKEAMEEEEDNRKLRGELDTVETRIESYKRDAQRIQQDIAELQRKHDAIAAEKTDARQAAKSLRSRVRKLKDPDVDAIRQQIAAAEDTNVAVRRLRDRRALEAEASSLESVVAKIQKQIDQVAEDKAKALAEASFPAGLHVTDEGVFLGDQPYSQASTSERIAATVAVAARLNPELKIALVRHGNDLDRETLAAFYDECQRQGVQPWVERIEPSSDGAIIIEEGQVHK